jgi:hypothetical protein
MKIIMDKHVLFVGNGFDRKIGLKTDYISFLEWMKKEGYGVGENFKENSNNKFSLYFTQNDF